MTLLDIDPPRQIDTNMYRFTWPAGNGGPYHVYLRGRYEAQVNEQQYDVHEPDGSIVPTIEVSDTGDDDPLMFQRPERHVMQWYHPADAANIDWFRVEENVGGDWTGRELVSGNPGGYITFTGGRKDHDVTSNFRVVAVLADGTEQDAVASGVLIARRPDVPRVTYEYDAGAGTVDVKAA